MDSYDGRWKEKSISFLLNICSGQHEKLEDILRAFGMDFYGEVTEKPENVQLVFQSFSEVGLEEALEIARSYQLRLHEKVCRVMETAMRNGPILQDVDPNLAAWQFMSIGITISMMSVLGLKDRLAPERVLTWGDTFVETLKSSYPS